MTDQPTGPAAPEHRHRDLAMLFLRLGTTAFGGPAAHIAMMREEVVRRRGWVDDQRFLDLVGATNLIPGPNSTELAIHLGHERGRWRGLLVAGVCFIVPAAVMVGVLAWAYVRYGTTPAGEGLLYGIKPVVTGIIVWALAGLLRTAVKGPLTAGVALVVLVAYLTGINELLLLAGGGLAGAAAPAGRRWRAGRAARGRPGGRDGGDEGEGGGGGAGGGIRSAMVAPLLPLLPVLLAGSDERLGRLFITMLKIGSVLYGSGYVLLAFLRGDFVERLGWLTEQQLLDAVSVGQLTPGPVFTTATFVGYLVAGLPGAVLATIAIFLPSFVFVGLLTRLTDRLRSTSWSAAALDGVNAAVVALMAGVSYQLGRTALVDPLTVALAAGTVVVLWRTRLNSAWLIAAGTVVGLVVTFLG